MKSSLNRWLCVFMMAFSLLSISGSSGAYWVHHDHRTYVKHRRCEWVHGHWNGHHRWIPGHRVCWR